MMTEKITLTKSQLDSMSRDELTSLLLRASRVEASAVVRRADGSVKYDDPSKAGTYGEVHLKEEDRG